MPNSSDILEIAKRIGLRKAQIQRDELFALCINPKHDDRTVGNFSISLRTGKYYCFACGYKGNIISYCHKQGISYTESQRLWHYIQLDLLPEFYVPAMPLDEGIYREYIENGFCDYSKKRIKNDCVLRDYDIYCDGKDNPIFLIRDFFGQVRAVWVRENGRYLLMLPLTSKSDGWLYGMHLKPTESSILVEGHFDAPAIYNKTGLKTVASMGTQLTKAQISNLEKLQPIYIMFDGDWAGKLARSKLAKKLWDLGYDYKVCGGYDCDPDEIEDVDKILAKAMNKFDYKEWMQKYEPNFTDWQKS